MTEAFGHDLHRHAFLDQTSTTDVAPAKDIRQRCLDLEQEDGVLRCAFSHGFPFTDIPATGASVVVTLNDDQALAAVTARRIAGEIWERRYEFLLESLTPEIAIQQAVRISVEKTGPVVNDTADHCGGGSPGDATHVLRALIEADPPGKTRFGFIFDPDVAEQATTAGPGATIDVTLGGKHDDLHGDPIKMTAHVKTTSDGRFTFVTPMLSGSAQR